MGAEAGRFGVAKTIFFSLIITSLGFVTLDWISSYLAFPRPSIETPPKSHYFEFDPILMWRLSPGYRDDKIAISEDGFRCDERIEAGSGRKLIFVVGGSTVFGLGSRSDQTVSYFLQRLLDARPGGERFEVVNAGVTGYYSTQELILAHRKLIGYAPSVIVALTGRNDVFYALHPAYRADAIPYHGQIRSSVGALDPYFTPGEGREPRMHMMRLMARTLRAVVEEDWAEEWSGPGLRFHPEAVDIFIRNQLATRALLKGMGVEYHLFLQPIISWPPHKQAPQESALPRPAYLDLLTDGYRRLVEKADGAFDRTWYHGLMALPENVQEALFIDNVHFSEVGAREAARTIARALVGEVGVPWINFADGPQTMFLGGGWHDLESGYRWTRKQAEAVVRCPSPGRHGLRFRMSGNAGRVPARLRITFRGNTVIESDLDAGQEIDLAAGVPSAWAGSVETLSIELSRTWVPKDLGINDDPRELGILVRAFGIEAVD
ncbi:MAG: SGNH/GDSL hydrolase family protein [Acidobacteriota bacterium]